MSDAHVAFIVEDDPQIAEILKEFVTSLGHTWLHATTLAEVCAIVATEGSRQMRRAYCYVLLDMQIPADGSARPSVGCGETALQLIRRAAPERNGRDKHILPILIVTGYSRDLEFVSKMYEMDANCVIPKPFGERIDLILDKIRAALVRAEREEHTACKPRAVATPSEVSATPPSATTPEVRIEIPGSRTKGRTDVLVNGVGGSLQDMLFVIFLNIVVAHRKTPGAWSGAAKLGMARKLGAPSRIRGALKALLPDGFLLVETEKGVGFRLNPRVEIVRVEWAALREHPQAGVRKVAAEHGAG